MAKLSCPLHNAGLSKEGSGPFSRAHTMSSVPSLKPDMVDRPASAMNISPTYTASMSVTQQLSVSEIKKTSQLDEDMIALAEEVDFMCDVVEDYHPVVTGRIQLFVSLAIVILCMRSALNSKLVNQTNN